MTDTLNKTPIDSSAAPVRKGSLWKISADSTPDMQSITFPGTVTHQRFFNSTLHPSPGSGATKYSVRYQPDWILGILIFCFIIIAWVQFFFPRRLRQILIAPYSKRNLNLLVREGKLLSERIAVALGTIYMLLFPLMIYMVYDLMENHRYSNLLEGYMVYFLLILLLGIFWGMKILLMKFLGTVFRTKQTTSEYILNVMLFNFLTGLALLPLLVAVVYVKSVMLLQICLVITLLFFIISFFRGFLIGFSLTKFSYLYLIVYLCTLEILPFIVLMKVFTFYFN
jgi:hypothetical protein